VTIWIDAQLSPALALWITQTFGINAVALRDIGLRDETDRYIFLAAKQQSTIVVTKDADFVRLLEQLGPPPQIIWITCGNTSNARLRTLLQTALPKALEFLSGGESLVEVSDLHEPRGKKP
jgi:predicted nuclease of predicted toxin-antitoxin system